MLRRAVAQLADCSCSQRACFATAASASVATSSSVADQDFATLYNIVKEQKTPSPQRPFKFMQLFAKASNAEEAQEALQLLERDRQLRSKQAMHAPYDHRVSAELLKALQRHGATASLLGALERAHKLGITAPRRVTSHVLRQLAQAGDLQALEVAYLLASLSMPRPRCDMLFVLAKTFAEAGQPAKVLEYAAEARRLGYRLPPALVALQQAAEAAVGQGGKAEGQAAAA